MSLEEIVTLPATKREEERSSVCGETPLHPVYLMFGEHKRLVHLKLEGENPTGSMKDRTALSLVRNLEEQGKLKPGMTIVESTSGNLGVALASIARARGYHLVLVVDPKTTPENLERMSQFGAQIEMVTQADECGGYLLSRLKRVHELCQQSEEYLWTDQYNNPANPAIHYTQTGPEIYHQMQGRVDAVFVPVSTGGTLAGIGRFFREISPATQIIGVDAHGSVIFGTPPAPRRLTGIGSSRPSSFLHQGLYDLHMLVKDEEAFLLCRTLYRSTGLMVGGSSGAVLAACTRYLAAHPTIERVVCVCADRGQSYASTIFHDDWIEPMRLHDVDHVLRSASFQAIVS